MFVSSLTALVLTMSVAQDAAEPAPETAAGSAPAPQLQLDIAPPRTEGMVRRSAGQYAAYHGVVADLREVSLNKDGAGGKCCPQCTCRSERAKLSQCSPCRGCCCKRDRQREAGSRRSIRDETLVHHMQRGCILLVRGLRQ